MNELSQLIYNRVKDDASFILLTGATATDPRIYYAFPWAQRAISRAKPSYVTWYVGASGGVPDDGVVVVQIPEQTYTFDIWSRSPDQARLVEERLMLLLHSQSFESGAYKSAYMQIQTRNEMGEEDIKGAQTHVNMTFSLGPIVRKSGKFYSTE